jgi:putative membrane protein
MGAIELLILLLLFLLLIGGGIAVVVFAVSRASRRTARPAGEESAIEILRRRYARGEITREEYQAMRQDLEM